MAAPCMRANCSVPAAWKAHIYVMPVGVGMHSAAGMISCNIEVCAEHKATTPLKMFMPDKAQRELTEEMEAAG
ncbi:hypothetical protein LCGC14_1292810 [marine sediment metagenome]|uniref:Uncharacterized protein n=1 Tax=marine sediment metagenome TaxID=412755 RepID=A0A0F9KTM1_9ZZZZ